MDIIERLHHPNRGGALLQNGWQQLASDAADEIERLRAALLSAHEAMLNWHCLSQEDRDEATNAAILNEQAGK